MTEKQALEAAKKQLGQNVVAEITAEGKKRLVFGREDITIRWEVDATRTVTENVAVEVKTNVPAPRTFKNPFKRKQQTVVTKELKPVTKIITEKQPRESKEVREKISSTADTWDLALERLLTAASRCEKQFLEKPWPYY